MYRSVYNLVKHYPNIMYIILHALDALRVLLKYCGIFIALARTEQSISMCFYHLVIVPIDRNLECHFCNDQFDIDTMEYLKACI